jgi:hypothetical protein
MTLVQICDEILEKMEATIHKLDDVLGCIQKKQQDLKEAKVMPLLLSDPNAGSLIEGPHFPGVG